MASIESEPETTMTKPAIPVTVPIRRVKRLNPYPLTPTITPIREPQPVSPSTPQPIKEPDKVPVTK